MKRWSILRRGVLSIVVGCACVDTVVVRATAELPTLVNELLSTNAVERSKATAEALKAREVMIEQLLHAVRSPIGFLENFNGDTVRNSAIRMLGELRASQAAPVLIAYLVPQESQHGEGMQPPPARVALIKIGLPAIPHLLEKLASKPVSEVDVLRQDECLRVVATMLGMEGARTLLQCRINTLDDEVGTLMLRDALKKLAQDDRMHEAYGDWGMLVR